MTRHIPPRSKKQRVRKPRRRPRRTLTWPRTPVVLNTAFFWGLVVVCWWLMQMPLIGKPFSLLSTWVHEMGHGMGALISGGEFKRMIITPRFGGRAFVTTTGTVSHVMVLVVGLLGPSLVGAIMLIMSRGWHMSGFVLSLLCLALFTSAFVWAGDPFTKITLLTLAVAVFGVWVLGGRFIRSLAAQIIAIELCLNAVMGFDYFFSGTATVAGDTSASDTADLVQLLGGTHILWGLFLSVISILILWTAFRASGALDMGLKARCIG